VDRPPWWPRAVESDMGFGYEVGEPLLMLDRPEAPPADWGYPYMRFSYGYNGLGATTGLPYDARTDSRALGDYVPPRAIDWMPGTRQVQASRVKSPAGMIAIADRSPLQPGEVPHLFSLFSSDNSEAGGAPAAIHSGGANVLFCDGHVQWYRYGELTFHSGSGVADDTYRRVAPLWNRTHEP
jgi:prepilin-type processing-associated H-X9-DG protein